MKKSKMLRKHKDIEKADYRYWFLISLEESSFRRLVTIPMLSKMRFREIIEYYSRSPDIHYSINVCFQSYLLETKKT